MSNIWYDVVCGYCGAECWDDEMHSDNKCKQCHVESCNHTNQYKEMADMEVQNRLKILIHCLDCGAYRYCRFHYPTKTKGYIMTLENWEHEEVNMEAIQ